MLIAGLGNPGAQYEGTPHNVGYSVVDALAARAGVEFRASARFRAWVTEGEVGGARVTLMKPATYMNASGDAVGSWLRYYKIELDGLVVVYDDVDLPLGRIRIRAAGGSGGHNGVRSVIEQAGGEGFTRVRLGIGRREERGSIIAHVLSPFGAADRDLAVGMVGRAAEAVAVIVQDGTEQAMNRFNQAAAQDKEQEKES